MSKQSDLVYLQSNDLVNFPVSRKTAEMSGLVRSLLQELGDADDTLIPLPCLKQNLLKYVVDYLEYHAQYPPNPIERPLRRPIEEVICEWDYEFLFTDLVKDGDENDHKLLVEMIMAANYLEVQPLVDLCSACMASIIKGKQPDQLRDLFNIENDLTPDEEEKIQEQLLWCGGDTSAQ